MGQGYLTVKVSIADEALPVEGAAVLIKNGTGQTLFTLQTDSSGLAGPVALYAPDQIHSLDPEYTGAYYAVYQVEVTKTGYVTEIIRGVQIFDGVGAWQEVEMHPVISGGDTVHITEIPPHKQVLRPPWDQQGPPESAPGRARVLSRVIIPDAITVHLGRYNDASARNIRVPFPLYIKNLSYTNRQTHAIGSVTSPSRHIV